MSRTPKMPAPRTTLPGKKCIPCKGTGFVKDKPCTAGCVRGMVYLSNI